MIKYIRTPKRKIKKEQERRKKSGAPACELAEKTLEAGNPAAADANDNLDKNHENENHEDRIIRHEADNGIQPRQNRSKYGSDVRNQSGKGTSSRRRQHSPF